MSMNDGAGKGGSCEGSRPLIRLDVKPLSVNECWQGQRFKTPAYKAYEKELLYKLPAMKMPDPPYKFTYEFGFSSVASDFDNPIKPLTDIMQKKYGFNDKDIHEATVRKVKVAKGCEYFTVLIEQLA